MEPITHVLTGACLSRAGLNRKTAFATATMALAAEAADIDVLYYFADPVVGFQYHRGWTHSVVGVPVMAALVVVVVWLWNRIFPRKPAAAGAPLAKSRARPPARWGLLYLYACLAAASHILLDFTNNYGVKPVAPLSYKWISWDILFIIEPVLLALLVLGLVMPSLFALVGEEIGARRQAFRGRGGALFALAGVLLVWGVRDYEHRRAVSALESFLYDGAQPLRVSAYPYAWNPFVWHGVVETENFFRTMEVDSLRSEIDPRGQARTYYKPEETPVTLAAKKSRLGHVYLAWAYYPMLEVERRQTGDSAYIVRFYDLRFQYPGRRTTAIRQLRRWVLRRAREGQDQSRRILGGTVALDENLQVVWQTMGERPDD